MAAFFEAGGRLIDSSPMYGSSQPTIGYGLKKLGYPRALFAAEKVWISDAASGAGQIEQSRRHWGVPRLDLVQVHNLLSWQRHLETLFAMKAGGKLRYAGITTSEGRRHNDIERILETQPIDTVQLTYYTNGPKRRLAGPRRAFCRWRAYLSTQGSGTVGDNRALPQFLKHLQENVFKGRQVKMRTRGADGRPVVGVLGSANTQP